ncbi:hypothetical protein [Nostoc sp. CHAB 5715]|uniref:hypothetical protein n=1 Tax=Nostoc sp. CHAB 5715 TaxID=2780400 RepID=UPI001E287C7C|nr:hypothetical protein [Nostoc sp. CHAB 5715]
MNIQNTEPKALFLSPDGNVYPDSLICSGIIPGELDGKPCPHSQAYGVHTSLKLLKNLGFTPP